MNRFIIALFIFLMLPAFSLQPADERAAQSKLPEANGLMWTALGGTVVDFDEKKGLYSATFSKGIKAMVGKEITLKGFMLPLESSEKFTHFILSKRTPTCQFCPPGTPTEIIDVFTDKKVAWDENMVTVTGTFSLENNQDLGMFFKLNHAVLK